MFAFGSIVLTRFPFTDLYGAKRRLALVVSCENVRRSELIVCFGAGPDIAPLDATPGTGIKVLSVVRAQPGALCLCVSNPSDGNLKAGPKWARPCRRPQ